jgi:hypothetical protein
MTRHRTRRGAAARVAAGLLLYTWSFGLSPVSAQSPATGAIQGIIEDETGLPLPDAYVILTDTASAQARTVSSDRNGRFRFAFLDPGTYWLSIERLGYAPRRLSGVEVRPGVELQLGARLEVLEGEGEVRSRPFGAEVVAGGLPGMAEWFDASRVRRLPHARRDVAELARLSSAATAELSVEGLPPWLSALAIDGVPFRPAAHPFGWAAPFATTAFSLDGAGPAHLVTNGVDAEWGGVAGGWLGAFSSRGTEALAVELRAAVTGKPLPEPSFVSDGAADGTGLQGSFAARGPLGTGRFSAGLALRQLETPVSPAWTDDDATAAVIAAAAGRDVDLDAMRRSGTAPSNAVTAFGRFDFPVAERHRLAGWGQVASLSSVPGFDRFTAGMPALDGTDIVAGASLLSAVRENTDNDLRVAVTSSTRSGAELGVVPWTTVVDGGLSFGAPPLPSRGEETRVLVSDAFHFGSGAHRLKVGGSFAASSHRYEHREGAAGEFLFGGASQLAAGTGVFTRTDASITGISWNSTGLALFVQDRWTAGEGIELLLGARVERESLPTDAALDEEWQRLSGISNDPGLEAKWLPSARVGLTWDVGREQRWLVTAGGGIYHDRVDPLLLAHWQMDDGDARVRREVGAVSWPRPTTAGAALPRLTVLGPGFEPPRTSRVSAGIAHRVASGTALSASAVFRRTDNLPRRSDLNLLPLPAARDQFGRAIFGTLLQQGALLVAEPGSSRRFETYDEVAGITADGWSEHWGLTVGVDHAAPAGLSGFARYTYGSTTDNWFGARHGGWTLAPPAGLDAEGRWTEGTSDFDVPHRAVAGVTWVLPFGARVGALYRLQSGLPFTPGFRAGVDASGTGSPGADPAFIEPSLVGMTGAMNAWPCLRDSAGRFAARNSCRAAMSHALDISAGLAFAQLGNGRTARVFFDVFDLLDSAGRLPDTALLLVDPAGTLGRDAQGRNLTVPVMVNPYFGEDLPGPRAGRSIRVGLSLNW